MKKFFISLVLIISLLFNVFADNKQAHKELRETFENYGLLPELIEKGFSLDKLDEIDDPVEMRDYLQPFFMDENGMPLDNHATIEIKYDINGYVYKMANVKTRSSLCIDFSDVYGSKKELLKKGYKEDEIFYYPYFNSEWKDGYRVGKKFMGTPYKFNRNYDMNIIEAKNTLYIRVPSFSHFDITYFDNIAKSNKKNLVIDITGNVGGSDAYYDYMVKCIKKMNPQKVYLLIDGITFSEGDRTAYYLKFDIKNLTVIGMPSNGALSCNAGAFKKIQFDNSLINIGLGNHEVYYPQYPTIGRTEGIGATPDIYTSDFHESIEVVKYLTKDFELNIE